MVSVKVTPELVLRHIKGSEVLERTYEFLETDDEIQELIKMSNIMAVGRLKYNDHGIVHSRIVAGSSLEILQLLLDAGVKPTTLEFGTAKTLDEVKVIIMVSAYLHDIGNSVHRVEHEELGALIAKDILDRMLPQVLPNIGKRVYNIRHEIMHAIYATEMNVQALTMEAGVVKVADGTDMAEGRARIPYMLGKLDMHAVSALSVKKVVIRKGKKAPARIDIVMDDFAGLFQVEEVLRPKIDTSGIGKYLEVYVKVNKKENRVHPP